MGRCRVVTRPKLPSTVRPKATAAESPSKTTNPPAATTQSPATTNLSPAPTTQSPDPRTLSPATTTQSPATTNLSPAPTTQSLDPTTTDSLSVLVGELSGAVARQADAMRHLAELTADSLRAATGAYVFQLRDRFDESLPVPQLGVVEASWVGIDGATDEAADVAIEDLVLHPGDFVRFRGQVLCNQAAVRRVVAVEPSPLEGLGSWGAFRFTVSETRHATDERFILPANVSLFIELHVDVPVEKIELGEIDVCASCTIEISDVRPEGAVSSFTVQARARAIAVPDDDGIGLEAARVELMIHDEQRAYYLDKSSQLPLSLPVRIRQQ